MSPESSLLRSEQSDGTLSSDDLNSAVDVKPPRGHNVKPPKGPINTPAAPQNVTYVARRSGNSKTAKTIAAVLASLVIAAAALVVVVKVLGKDEGAAGMPPTMPPSIGMADGYFLTDDVAQKDYRCQNIKWKYTDAETPESCLDMIVKGDSSKCGLDYLTWNYVNHGCACYPKGQNCTLQYEGGRETYGVHRAPPTAPTPRTQAPTHPTQAPTRAPTPKV